MTVHFTETQPAGWYAHPAGIPGAQMYWDGTDWQTSMVTYGQPTAPTSHGPMTASKLDVKREVIYNRQQKGHSLILQLFVVGPFTLWIPAIYYTVSPNHYWHA